MRIRILDEKEGRPLSNGRRCWESGGQQDCQWISCGAIFPAGRFSGTRWTSLCSSSPALMQDAASGETPGLWTGQLKRDVCEALGAFVGCAVVGGRQGRFPVAAEGADCVVSRQGFPQDTSSGQAGETERARPRRAEGSMELDSGLTPRELMSVSREGCHEVCSGCVVGECI